MSRAFGGRTVGSIVIYAILAGFGVSWLVWLVLIPMFTTPFSTTPTYLVNLFFQLLITALVVVAVSHNSIDLVSKAASGVVARKEGPRVKRWSLNQRIQHVWLLLTVAALALTGFAQMYYESWGRAIIIPMGGLQVDMDVHLLSAFLLGVLVVYHFALYAADYAAKRASGAKPSLAIMFGKKDISDFVQNLKYMFGRGEEPKYARYSYVQKFDYWGIYWGIIILGVPGVILWAYGHSYLGGLPFVFHTDEAMLAVLWLAVFHFYQGHFNPKKFPMNTVFLTGSLSEGEMREEHPLELGRAEGGVVR